MSVLIKGMEMPTNADMAPTAVWVYPNGHAIVFKDNGKMKQYTEAVPVPPHGRLIDAGALEHIIGQFSLNWEYGQGVSDCWDALIAAPTVIEAEEGE